MKKKEYKKKLEREKFQKLKLDFSSKDDTMKVVKIFVGVLGFIFVMFIITKFITGEWSFSSKDKDNDTTDTITNKTFCGNIFNISESGAYYVLMYNFNGDDASIFEVLKSNYETKTSKKNIYVVDLGNILNKSCLADGTINIVNDASLLKVSSPTLLKIENRNIIDNKMGKDSIKSYLNSLTV